MIQQIHMEDVGKERWNAIASHNMVGFPFHSYEWHQYWRSVFGAEGQDFTLLIDNEVIVPLIVQNNTVTFSGGKEISDYMDILGPDEKKQDAWNQIFAFCQEKKVERLELHNIPQSSTSLKVFSPTEIAQEDSTPFMELPDRWETYVESLDKHKRHELRRKIKKFEDAFGDLHIVESHRTQADIDEAIRLMKLDERKQTFLTPEMEYFFRGLPDIFSSAYSLLFLKVNGVNAAMTISFVTEKELFLYNSGADLVNYPNCGFYLKAKSIEWAIQQKKKVYNFLQGQERYKYDLGGRDFFVYNATKTLTPLS